MSTFIDIIKKKLSYNQNAIGFVVGSKGAGKSYACLRLGEVFDSNFGINNVCFSVKEVVYLLKAGKLKPGSVVVFEEVGVNIDARNFYDKLNKNMNYILETFRTARLVFLMNVPDQSFADKKARKMADFIITMHHVDMRSKRGIASIKWVQNNPVSGDTYYKSTKGIIDGVFATISMFRFRKPKKRLCNYYEKKRQLFLDSVIQKAADHFKPKAKVKLKSQLRPDEHLQILIKKYKTINKVAEYFTSTRGIIPIRKIQGHLGISESKSIAVRDLILEKLS